MAGIAYVDGRDPPPHRAAVRAEDRGGDRPGPVTRRPVRPHGARGHAPPPAAGDRGAASTAAAA
jgi:hypothetical protein